MTKKGFFAALSLSACGLAGLLVVPAAVEAGNPKKTRVQTKKKTEKPKVITAGKSKPDSRHAKVVAEVKSTRAAVKRILSKGTCEPAPKAVAAIDTLIADLDDLEAGTFCCNDCGDGQHGSDVTCTGCSKKNPHLVCPALTVDCTGTSVFDGGGGGLTCF